MKTRGRKSASSLSIAYAADLERIVPPPAYLSPSASEVWRVVMGSTSGTMIGAESLPVLAEYCKAVESAEKINDQLSNFDPEWLKDSDGLLRFEKLVNIQDKIAKLMVSMAVKLRITPSTRYQAKDAFRRQEKHATVKPWEEN